MLGRRFLYATIPYNIASPLDFCVNDSEPDDPRVLFIKKTDSGTLSAPSSASLSSSPPQLSPQTIGSTIIAVTTALQPWSYGMMGNTTSGMLFDGVDLVSVTRASSTSPHLVEMRLLRGEEALTKRLTSFPKPVFAHEWSGDVDEDPQVGRTRITHSRAGGNGEGPGGKLCVSWLAHYLARVYQALKSPKSFQFVNYRELVG